MTLTPPSRPSSGCQRTASSAGTDRRPEVTVARWRLDTLHRSDPPKRRRAGSRGGERGRGGGGGGEGRGGERAGSFASTSPCR